MFFVLVCIHILSISTIQKLSLKATQHSYEHMLGVHEVTPLFYFGLCCSTMHRYTVTYEAHLISTACGELAGQQTRNCVEILKWSSVDTGRCCAEDVVSAALYVYISFTRSRCEDTQPSVYLLPCLYASLHVPYKYDNIRSILLVR